MQFGCAVNSTNFDTWTLKIYDQDWFSWIQRSKYSKTVIQTNSNFLVVFKLCSGYYTRYLTTKYIDVQRSIPRKIWQQGTLLALWQHGNFQIQKRKSIISTTCVSLCHGAFLYLCFHTSFSHHLATERRGRDRYLIRKLNLFQDYWWSFRTGFGIKINDKLK